MKENEKLPSMKWKELAFGIYTVYFKGPRDQDCVFFDKANGISGIVDGWNNKEIEPGDEQGRLVAKLVGKQFPHFWQESREKDIKKKAREVCDQIDKLVREKFPLDSSSVFVFVIPQSEFDVIVSVGGLLTYFWNGSTWQIPEGFSDHALSLELYESDVARFVGRNRIRNNPIYTSEPDVTTVPKDTPIILFSDGMLDLIDNRGLIVNELPSPELGISKVQQKISDLITAKLNLQKDDLIVLLKMSSD